MPHKRKRSRYWWVSYIDPSGKRVRRSTGTTDRKEAEALEAKWKLEAFRVQQWEEQPSRSFEELMVAYLNATQQEKRSAERDRRMDEDDYGHPKAQKKKRMSSFLDEIFDF